VLEVFLVDAESNGSVAEVLDVEREHFVAGDAGIDGSTLFGGFVFLSGCAVNGSGCRNSGANIRCIAPSNVCVSPKRCDRFEIWALRYFKWVA